MACIILRWSSTVAKARKLRRDQHVVQQSPSALSALGRGAGKVNFGQSLSGFVLMASRMTRDPVSACFRPCKEPGVFMASQKARASAAGAGQIALVAASFAESWP